MKRFFCFTFIILFMLTSMVSAENYAVIITGDDPNNTSEGLKTFGGGLSGGADCFWYDTYLMWETLYNFGFKDENIYVLYAGGTGLHSTNPFPYCPLMYNPLEQYGIGDITDYSATRTNVINIFTWLADGHIHPYVPQITSEDLLVIYTVGHGLYEYQVPGHTVFYTWNTMVPEWIIDYELADLLDDIQCQKKVVLMQQCFSGGFISYLENSSTFIMTACSTDEESWPADDVNPDGADLVEHEQQNVPSRFDHGEFSYHLINSANLETISGNDISSLVDSDDNDNASLNEMWAWVNTKESLRELRSAFGGAYIFGPENPQYSDLGGIGATTNLNVPPVQPAGFNLTGNIGQNPTLSWYPNTDVDLDGYKIYVKYGGGSEQLLTTVDAGTTSFTDNGVVITGGRGDPLICYRISAFDLANNESDKTNYRCVRSDCISKPIVPEEISKIPDYYKLYQAYPNPFNPNTTIKFDLVEDNHVKIFVYNNSGQIVKILADKFIAAGTYEVIFEADNLPSGIYFYKIQAGAYKHVKRMLLLK